MTPKVLLADCSCVSAETKALAEALACGIQIKLLNEKTSLE